MNTEVRMSPSRLGAFDLFKGLGMVLVVFSHTVGLFGEYLPAGKSLTLLFAPNVSFMMTFFIISGMGVRKTQVRKCIRIQSRMFLPPYLYVSAGTIFLHFFIHANLFFRGNPQGILIESTRVAGGFLFGLPHTATYFGHMFYPCGPMWFLLSLWFGWIFFVILLNILPPRFVPVSVLLLAQCGWLMCTFFELPFCLSQSLIVVLFLFIGYQAKQKRIFDDPRCGRYVLLLLASLMFIYMGALITGKNDNITDGYWTLGFFGIILNGTFAFSMVYFIRRWNCRNSRFLSFFEPIGCRSLTVLCLHTIEMIAVPWNHLPVYFENSVFLGIMLVFLMRCVVIIALYFTVAGIKKLFRPKVT